MNNFKFQINRPITTLESIIRTIDSDNFTYQWFLFLINQQRVKEVLKDNPVARESYPLFDKILFGKKSLTLLFLIYIGAIIWYRAALYFWGLIIFAGLYFWMNRKLKNCVKVLSEQLLHLNFENQDFKNKTLYQISSYYRKGYRVPSLIDCICYHDRALRKTVLLLPLFLFIIYPINLSFPEMSLLMTVSLYSVYRWTCSKYLYQKLSKE